MMNLERIKNRRKELRLKQRDMAEVLGYQSVNGYWQLEAGLVNIKANQVPLLATALGVDIEELYSGR